MTSKFTTLAFTLLLFLLLAISLLIGEDFQSLTQIANEYGNDTAWLILMEIRMPRSLLAMLIGFVLGLSGAVMQGYLRNPLAEPTILGVSSTASLGAVIALYFGLANSFALAAPLMGMACAMIGLIIMIMIAGRQSSILILILSGIAVSTMAGALLSLALNFSPSPYASLEIIFWLMGSVSDRDWNHLWLIMPFVLVGCFLLWLTRHGLDALTFGEDVAKSMGINLNKLRWLVILGVGLAVGSSVSVVGTIGFIGLIVPHIVRVILGELPSRIILPSGLLGATLLLFADILVRVLPTDTELKLGVLTSLLGTPLFLYILFKHRHRLY